MRWSGPVVEKKRKQSIQRDRSPILVKRGRGTVKRYGIIFTCMTIRAVHLEILPSLSTDAFIDALRRFICRRGQPRRLVSDNGTNFVGAYRQLGDALNEHTGNRKLRAYLQLVTSTDVDGGSSSTWSTDSGDDGRGSTCLPSNIDRSGCAIHRTLMLETLFSSWTN